MGVSEGLGKDASVRLALALCEKYGMCKEPTFPCDLKIGDRVKFVNHNGVEFVDQYVIGFAKVEDAFNGRFIYQVGQSALDAEDANGHAWWFPAHPDELTKL